MKRKLTLGLMVFFVGVLITACGSDSNTTNTTNNNAAVSDLLTKGSCNDCIKDFNGKFVIQDDELYLEAFGLRSGSGLISLGNTNDGVRGILNQVLSNAANNVFGRVVCEADTRLNSWISDLFNDPEDHECTFERDGDFFGDDDDDNNVRSSYNATLEIQYEDKKAEAVRLTVKSDLDDDDQQEAFYFDRSKVYINREGTLMVVDEGDKLRLKTIDGNRIGYFRK